MESIYEELRHKKISHSTKEVTETGLPDWSRTNGIPLRRRTLYPTEVQADASKL